MADSHSSSRKQFKFEIMLDRFFSNFLKIILTNILFFIPLAVAVSLYIVSKMFVQGVLLTAIICVLAVLVFPFYAGVVLVTRNIARGDKDISVFSTFLKGVRENFLRFLVYGILFTVLIVFSYFSISIYAKLAATSWIFYVTLFLCVLIAIAVLFVFYYVPVMTVTFDLSIKHTLKNAFLMSFGELKNNFFATVWTIIVLAIALTIVAFCTEVTLLIIVTVLLIALFLPATCQMVSCFYIYDDMYAMLTQNTEVSADIGKTVVEKDGDGTQVNTQTDTVEDYSDIDISTLKDNDEYIFYNGKMIKQSVLLRKVLEQRELTGSKTERKED